MTVPRDDARRQLEQRILLGRDLCARDLRSEPAYEAGRREYRTWTEYNAALLERLFADRRERATYESWFGVSIPAYPPPLHEKIADLRGDIDDKVRRLESVVARLELAEEPAALGPSMANVVVDPDSIDVFLVHGRDDGTKETIARFIERLGLRPVILHEQANRGRTLIEKFEDHANVAYAVVVLTPDDVGALAADTHVPLARARQNVVFELGFFFGKLGRERVCALVAGTLERPSDTDGIVYISIDRDSWKLPLAAELKAAGLPVDMNRAV